MAEHIKVSEMKAGKGVRFPALRRWFLQSERDDGRCAVWVEREGRGKFVHSENKGVPRGIGRSDRLVSRFSRPKGISLLVAGARMSGILQRGSQALSLEKKPMVSHEIRTGKKNH